MLVEIKIKNFAIINELSFSLEEGLNILDKVKQSLELPIVTDIHLPEQAAVVAEVADVLQTPAFLCRQTDLLVAAGATGKVVNIKKGQFLHPSDMKHAANKVTSSGNSKILLCERGACFGYRDLVVDPRSLHLLSEIGFPVVFDATHSVQSMGGGDGSSGGNREFIEPLVKMGVALGVDALFIECHDAPETAPSDGASMLQLGKMAPLIERALKIREAALSSI